MEVRIGTSEIGGTFHRQGEAVGNLLRNNYDVKTIPVTGSSIGSSLGLHYGDLHFGFSASNWIGRALRGETPFKEPISIKMAAPANVGPMFFIVKAESDLYLVDDIKGKKLSVNFRDSGMFQHILTIFKVLGISFEDFDAHYLGFEEGAEALQAEEIDVQWQCPVPNPVMTKLAKQTDLRVLEYSPGQLEKVIDQVEFYRSSSLLKTAFRGLTKDTKQVGVLNVIATHERTSEKLVFELVSEMVNNAEELGQKLELYAGLSSLFNELKSVGRKILEPDGVTLHPGALQAYKELGFLD